EHRDSGHDSADAILPGTRDDHKPDTPNAWQHRLGHGGRFVWHGDCQWVHRYHGDEFERHCLSGDFADMDRVGRLWELDDLQPDDYGQSVCGFNGHQDGFMSELVHTVAERRAARSSGWHLGLRRTPGRRFKPSAVPQ